MSTVGATFTVSYRLTGRTAAYEDSLLKLYAKFKSGTKLGLLLQ